MFRMMIIFPLLLLFAARSALSSILDGSITLSSHSDEPTEEDTVELTCNITSTYLPATNRSTLHYYWTVYYGLGLDPVISCHNSSGPAMDRYGKIIPGYSFKDDGKTLVIDSVRYNDKYFICRGSDNERTYPDRFKFGSAFKYCLQIRHKPYIEHRSIFHRDSKKFHAAINDIVSLSFECGSYPPYSPKGNWTFVNFHGVSKDLPPNSDIKFDDDEYGSCLSECSLRFNFASVEYYGNYSFNMTNDMGSATITFQVLPGDPPDTPSNVRIQNVTHDLIAVEFNLMWWNSFERQQPCVQLTLVETGAMVVSSDASYDFNLRNPTYIYRFLNNQPETKYKVSVWSRNKFGKSQVVELEVETQKDPNFNFRSSFFLRFLVFLGTSSPAWIAFLIAYLVKRFRRNREPQQPSQIAMQEVSAGSPQSDAIIVYERVRVNLRYDEHPYTCISQTRSQDQ